MKLNGDLSNTNFWTSPPHLRVARPILTRVFGALGYGDDSSGGGWGSFYNSIEERATQIRDTADGLKKFQIKANAEERAQNHCGFGNAGVIHRILFLGGKQVYEQHSFAPFRLSQL